MHWYFPEFLAIFKGNQVTNRYFRVILENILELMYSNPGPMNIIWPAKVFGKLCHRHDELEHAEVLHVTGLRIGDLIKMAGILVLN